MSDERTSDMDMPNADETYGQGSDQGDAGMGGTTGGTGSTSGTGAGGGGMGSGLGETGDQGMTPGMGTGDPGEGSTGSTDSSWGTQNQGEDARQPGTGGD